jgi:prepilin-type N-terminal cleavage/methylation domain-containing protein
MAKRKRKAQSGFSLIELLIAMTVVLMLLAVVSSLLSTAMSVRTRQSRKTDALTSAQAALNILSREIANSGYGIGTCQTADCSVMTGNNGIVLADSDANRIHLRTNLTNTGPRSVPAGSTVMSTNQSAEDVTYFFDAATDSIVRFDRNGTPQTSVVVNKISNVVFTYYNYSGSSSAPTQTSVPTANTGRVKITVTVQLEPVVGQPNESVTFSSEVTLRNVEYMLRQY